MGQGFLEKLFLDDLNVLKLRYDALKVGCDKCVLKQRQYCSRTLIKEPAKYGFWSETRLRKVYW